MFKDFKELKKFVEDNTRCKLRYISSNKFDVLEPYCNNLDGKGWSKTTIEHAGTIESMIATIINEYCGFNPWGDYDYYGELVELLQGEI